ncbi:MAG: aldehyde ferredoxin oxidoreductase C-terminal domain-containing protein, partial [Dehalococcoidales bacterium]|nr:aldehyde ferredoxin oxidoreductase C-terminal domain-containing protein [Dehalococcoidales bacterium]
QRPAVLCIGPTGENLSSLACLMHDLHGAGQGGFGAVFGSKNLKAISVTGTGSIEIAYPQALLDAWLWWKENFQYDVDNPRRISPDPSVIARWSVLVRSPAGGTLGPVVEPSRPHACQACGAACGMRTQSGIRNEGTCMEASFSNLFEAAPKVWQKGIVTDLIQYAGINSASVGIIAYLRDLYKMGILGPGKAIDCDLPFEKYGTREFIEAFIKAIAYREGIGEDLASGPARAAKKWGRYDEDTASGLLPLPNWGYRQHYEPRAEVEWSYGSLLGDRDINEHGINHVVMWLPMLAAGIGVEPYFSAQKLAEIMASKVPPYEGDPFMFDYSEGPTGIYSEHRAKTIAWHRHYTRFWKQSALYCDWMWPLFVSPNAADMLGPTPEGEPKFFNAVTGKDLSFNDGMEIGRKIWNLDRSIWALQGRHRDMEVFSEYVYNVPTTTPYYLPIHENGKWSYSNCIGRTLSRTGFEDWKTKYYKLEGWDPSSGWPTRNTLEEQGLKKVADELQSKGKLGS